MSLLLLYSVITLFIIILIKSKWFYSKLMLNHNTHSSEKVKCNSNIIDPESERIDGNGRCYPHCSSDVWLRSCQKEIIEPIEGHYSGNIPKWLNGSLLRNGPGSWEVGDMKFQHLFDCSALLHRFAINNGHVTYQNRFVKTETWKKNNAAQRIVVTEFGTAAVPDPCKSIFDKISAIFRTDSSSDNSMISIYPFGDEFYTFTEVPFIHRINPRSLDTEARVCLSDYAGVVNHTSHPHIMYNGTVYNLGMTTTKSGPAYSILCFPSGNNMFEEAYVVGTIPCRWKLNPGYMHTFGITEHFFVIVEQPLSISLPEYVKAHIYNHNFSAALKWFEDKPTIFHLMDRQTGKVVYTYQSEAFFYLHIINQYEIDDHVVVDICCYKNPEMINCMYLESISNMQSNPNYANLFRGRPLRFVLPLNTSATTIPNVITTNRKKIVKSFSIGGMSSRLQQPKLKHSQSKHIDIVGLTTNCIENKNQCNFSDENILNSTIPKNSINLVTLQNTKADAYVLHGQSIMVRPELICDWGCETPRINYDRYLGKDYRYFYAISSDVDANHPGTIVKVDTLKKSYKAWYEENCYPSEPIFVAAPNSLSEDDGVILSSIVWGGLNENYVGLLVLCAKTWTELGRCTFHTNSAIPKCLHGWFAKDIV